MMQCGGSGGDMATERISYLADSLPLRFSQNEIIRNSHGKEEGASRVYT